MSSAILNKRKTYMKLFLTLICFFFITNSYSQTDTLIKSVHFHHRNGIIVGSQIDVYIYQDLWDDNHFYVEVKTSKSENKYPITYENILELSYAVSKILPNDIIKVDRTCLDGGDTEIKFTKSGDFQNSVKYSVNYLSSSDDKTAWKDYLIAVNLILDLAKLKFSDLK
jgi:hypothetical protein